MKKIFKEFKQFITRGNVIDLAVGMIIGAAFTAIVTALVNNIFHPLIDAIPMGDKLNGLITILVWRDADGLSVPRGSDAVDLTKSVYINWGAFIMAVINFLLTAIILFIVIKAINTFRDGANEYKLDISYEEKKQLRAQGMSRKQMKAYVENKRAEEKAKAEAEAKANAPETQEQILKDIRELLKSLQPAQAQAIEQAVDKVVEEQ